MPLQKSYSFWDNWLNARARKEVDSKEVRKKWRNLASMSFRMCSSRGGGVGTNIFKFTRPHSPWLKATGLRTFITKRNGTSIAQEQLVRNWMLIITCERRLTEFRLFPKLLLTMMLAQTTVFGHESKKLWKKTTVEPRCPSGDLLQVHFSSTLPFCTRDLQWRRSPFHVGQAWSFARV